MWPHHKLVWSNLINPVPNFDHVPLAWNFPSLQLPPTAWNLAWSFLYFLEKSLPTIETHWKLSYLVLPAVLLFLAMQAYSCCWSCLFCIYPQSQTCMLIRWIVYTMQSIVKQEPKFLDFLGPQSLLSWPSHCMVSLGNASKSSWHFCLWCGHLVHISTMHWTNPWTMRSQHVTADTIQMLNHLQQNIQSQSELNSMAATLTITWHFPASAMC